MPATTPETRTAQVAAHDIATSNSLADLRALINEAHSRAIGHAVKSVEYAVACGQMLVVRS